MTSYSKKLCMTEFTISRISGDGRHPAELIGKADRKSSGFGWLAAGTLTVTAGAERLTLRAGELFFLPEGISCRAEYPAGQKIDYYHITITAKKSELADRPVFALQRVDALCTDETGRRIGEIFSLFETGERTAKLRALGLYYILYAEILPHLTAAPPPHRSAAITDAIAYIEQHLADNYTIDELAAASAVSASHLFHLFRSELGITPIRFRNAMRVERAALDLRVTDDPIDHIAARYGFHSAAYFRETFKADTGMTPTDYRAAARNRPKED